MGCSQSNQSNIICKTTASKRSNIKTQNSNYFTSSKVIGKKVNLKPIINNRNKGSLKFDHQKEEVYESKKIIQEKAFVENRVEVNAERYPYSSIGFLQATFANNRVRGTAFLIGEYNALTCAHNCYDEIRGQRALSLQYRVMDQRYVVQQFKIPAQYQASRGKSTQFDYAILFFKQPIGKNYGYFGINFEPCGQIQNTIIAGFPKYGPGQKETMSLFQEKGSIKRSQEFRHLYSYKISTSSGQSGAPVFIEERGHFFIVALHTHNIGQYNYGLRLDEKIKNRLNEWIDKIGVQYILQNKQISDTQISMLTSNKQQKQIKSIVLKSNKLEKRISQINFLSQSAITIHKLKIIDNGVVQIPSDIFRLQNLTHLNLRGNMIKCIPKQIKLLRWLRKLHLQSNLLSNLTKQITQLEMLQYLNFSSNLVQIIPSQITNMKELREISFCNNFIYGIPESFHQLTNLEYLQCGNPEEFQGKNRFNQIPITFLLLPSIRVLNIQNCNIRKIPLQIQKCVFLEKLNLLGNQINNFPTHLTKLKSLKQFNIQCNGLKELPQQVGLMSGLQSLIAKNNKIVFLPKKIGKLLNLKTLILNKNSLLTLPPEIGQLSNLERLELEQNAIGSLPFEVGNLQNLIEMSFKYNLLTKLSFDISRFGKLKKANFSNNKIEKLMAPNNQFLNILEQFNISNNCWPQISLIRKFEKIKILQISSNCIKNLPRQLYQLKELQMLNFSNNQVCQITPDIGNLMKLKKIQGSKNKVRLLPKQIEKLVQIEYLDLDSNQLICIPDELVKLKALKVLHISNNKIESSCLFKGGDLQLKELFISNNTKIESFGRLQNVEILKAAKINIYKISEEIKHSKKLKQLDLSNNQLEKLQRWLIELPKVTSLKLQNNKLKNITQQIFKLKPERKLTIDLTNNQLDLGLKNHLQQLNQDKQKNLLILV